MAGLADSGARRADSGAGRADSGAGRADSGAGLADSGAGLADAGAGWADSGAGLADSGAGRADSGASPPTDTALSCPAHSYCTGCRGDVEQRRPHHLQHRPQCHPERVPELPGRAAAHGQRHADDVRAASQGSPHGGEQAVSRSSTGAETWTAT